MPSRTSNGRNEHVQHDMVIEKSGPAFRADPERVHWGDRHQSIQLCGPNPSYPFQFWADIGAGVLKMRNSANNAWIKLGLQRRDELWPDPAGRNRLPR